MILFNDHSAFSRLVTVLYYCNTWIWQIIPQERTLKCELEINFNSLTKDSNENDRFLITYDSMEQIMIFEFYPRSSVTRWLDYVSINSIIPQERTLKWELEINFNSLTKDSNENDRFLITYDSMEQIMIFEFYPRSSVTRWLDYVSIFGHLQQWKLAQ